MTDTVEQAGDQRLELLRRRLAERGLAATPTGQAGEPAAATMNDGQRRMWFVQALDPDGTVANISVSYRLTGTLDADRLRSALAAVADRHPLLRTTYVVDEAGEPQPRIADVTPGFAQHDLSELAGQARALRLEVLAQREFATPFRLDADAPLRLTLIRLAADEHVLLLVAHHIAWDDASWAVFFGDLTQAYTAPQAYAARPVAYALTAPVSTDHGADLSYWRTLLADPPDPLELPGPRGSAVPHTLRAGLCTKALPAELMDGITELARSNGATPYMVVGAALSALIQRYTGTDDFLIASPVLNRTAGTEDVIGYFGNTVVLRAKVDIAAPFNELLARTRDTALGAFAHQGINLDRVVRELNPDRRHGGVERLTRLSFGFRAGDGEGFCPDGIACARAEYRGKIAQLPLGIMVEAGATGALIEAEYLLDVLDEALVDQLLRHLVQLLGAAVAQPAATVGELDMLGDADRAWLDTVSRGPEFTVAPTTLGSLVADRAALTPAAIAVVDDHGRYSYAEINARANRIAHHLIASGIGTEDKVAVLMGRSLDLVVTALGIAKAGAAYVPVDPEYPPDRIEFILGDARAALVLREPLDPAVLAELPDTDPTDADRLRPLRPESLAYLIYTSGSTGLPKGVEVAHAPIAEYLAWFGGEYGIDETDVLLQVASPSFDVSVGELFGTLANGARLVIPRPDGLRDIGYLTDLLQREGVTAMHFVPSLLGLFLSLPGVNQWRTLRRIPIGGEPLPGELADKFHATFDALLHNFYGPTETVVNSTRFKVEGTQGNRIVPIGSPNINTTVRLLDGALQPVPVGVIGEIYIGGTHIARGYFDRPGLTAERFVADPWAAGQRLYRTGDLARRNAAGDLEFIGRADDQVKVRGFRIELGEVAAAISVDPSVGQCVVVVSDLPALGRSLVAYLTPNGPDAGEGPGRSATEGTVDIPRIRARVAAALPEYMAPAAYVVVDDIPITAHGKIDRAALPDPQPPETAPYREPATDTERAVAELFSQLLGRDRVGADDSFFDLGGHSLLATKLVAAIRARCGAEIGIRDIFESSTVARLATAIDLAEATPGRPPLVAVPRSGPLPVSASQLRTWFAYRLDPDATGDNIPLSARLTGPCDTAALIAAIGDVVARHDSLRTTFAEIDGLPHQIINPVAPIQVTELHCPATDPQGTADWTRDRLDEQRGLGFDLEQDWPIRAALLHLPGDERVLSLVVHHIAADHWSVEVLFTDLLIAYRARTSGAEPSWAPAELQYADFAHWQGELLRDESGLIEAQRRYWIEQLAGLADDTGPRPDFPRPATANGSGDSVAFTVTPAVRAGLAALARDTGATEFMVVQAAVAVLMHLAGSGDDIPLGVPIAGRTDNALDSLVGFFVNIVVLRNRLSGNPTLRDVVLRSRETALGAYAHADLPFDRLVEAVNPVRTLSRNPLFQVVVHVRDAADVTHVISSGEGGDLVFRTVMPTFDIAHADLSVNLFATAGNNDGAGYDGHLIYRTDLYQRETVQRLADWLGRVLEAMADAPERNLREISLVDDDQRRVILDEWSRGAEAPDTDPRTIAEVLAPSREFTGVAVRCAGAQLSYPQLHSRSDRLAELLIEHGVRPGTLVGLSVRRDLDLPVALVGIMKAGAGFFPLDPSYPRQRLEFMVDDISPRVIVVSSATRDPMPTPDGVRLLCLDDADVQAELAKDAVGENLPIPHPDHPMFLVFTSGSTGTPKGVLGTHRSMSARLNWQLAHYPVAADDIRLAQSSMTFLEGGMEMLAGLAAGATMILADDDEFRDPEALGRLIARERVAQVTAVASLISVLVDSAPEAVRGLQRLVCSGEPVSADLLARLAAVLDPKTQLLNNFGATETSGAVVRGELAPPTPKLGRPTPGSQAYVLDDALAPVPPGVVGEVYYAGPQIVSGYWRRPDLTATRFIANPFNPGDRLYRSGDRARWSIDGVLEFVGRTDHQVKVRGFRVELAEVEAALRAAPGVAAAAARTWELRGVTSLAGYLVPAEPVDDVLRGGSSFASPSSSLAEPPAEFIASVRASVAATLPGYMVPASLTVLGAMPLTDSGKLNRPALPQPAVATRGEADPPVTATEKTLAGICAELLGVDAVGRSDGFFELGGDSILSVQLSARARAAGLQVDPRMIFEHPTFAELAAAVDAAENSPEVADTAFAPMSVSGLSGDALADLTAAWGDSP